MMYILRMANLLKTKPLVILALLCISILSLTPHQGMAQNPYKLSFIWQDTMFKSQEWNDNREPRVEDSLFLPCLNTAASFIRLSMYVEVSSASGNASPHDFVWTLPPGWSRMSHEKRGPLINGKQTHLISFMITKADAKDGWLQARYPADPNLAATDTLYHFVRHQWALNPPDTIFASGSYCADRPITLSVPKEVKGDTVRSGSVKYSWNIPGVSYTEFLKDTSLKVDFFPANLSDIKVTRYTCSYSAQSARFTTVKINLISDPPLDTVQDTIYRLNFDSIWRKGVWDEKYMTCVNYGQKYGVSVGGDINASGTTPGRFKMFNASAGSGFVFLQVGDSANPDVKYIWDYDKTRLERIGLEDVTWGLALNYAFQGTNSKGFPAKATDSTYRAIFRIKDRETDSLLPMKISVKPVCFTCVKNDGAFFENKIIQFKLPAPLDTVKPFNDFSLEVAPGWDPNPCVETEVRFLVKWTGDNASAWSRKAVKDSFNISAFFWPIIFDGTGKGISTIVDQGWEPNDMNYGVTVKFSPWKTGTGATDAERFSHRRPARVAQANSCFHKYTGLVVDTAYWSGDSIWTKRPPYAPEVLDELGNLIRPNSHRNPDTLLLCKNPIRDFDSKIILINGNPKTGVVLNLRNKGDSLVTLAGPTVPADKKITGFHFWGDKDQGSPNYKDESLFFSVLDAPKKDSSQLRLVSDPNLVFFGQKDTIVLLAQNKCGIGDSTVIHLRITDTIKLDPLGIYAGYINPADGSLGWTASLSDTTPCEGTDIRFRVGIQNTLDLDKAQVHWTAPNGWNNRVSLSATHSELSTTVAQTTGYMTARMVNVCGASTPDTTQTFIPIPYFRPHWQSFPNPVCKDSIYRYAFDSTSFSQKYYIQFPSDWKITGNSNTQLGNNTYADSLTLAQVINSAASSVYFDVKAGHQSGTVRVRGLHPKCDISLNRTPLWDSAKVVSYVTPTLPRKNGIWKDTVCARDTVWFSVQAAVVDSNQNNGYIWLFPNDQWRIVKHNLRSDSVRVLIGPRSQVRDTIRVFAQTLSCGQRSGDTLKHLITVWDTATSNNIFDDYTLGQPLGLKPCQGETLGLYIRPSWDVDSIVWRWGPSQSDNRVDADLGGNWTFPTKNRLPDTLDITAPAPTFEKASLPLTLQLRNRCGYNTPRAIELFSSAKIPVGTKPVFTRFDSVLCAGEIHTYICDSNVDADRYIWTFPFAPTIDTISMTPRIDLKPTATGPVSVRAINNCSQSDWSDPVNITQIKRAPKRPIPSNFALSMKPHFGKDTLLLDTLCLRQDHRLRLLANPADPDLNLDFDRFLISGTNIPGILSFTPKRDSLLIPAERGTSPRPFSIYGFVARRTNDGCTVGGDTLKIRFAFVDTTNLNLLGRIVLDKTDVCYGEIVTATVENPVAWSYNWYFPDTTYTILGISTDQHKSTIRFKAGKTKGRIGLTTTAGFQPNYCGYENRGRLFSDSVKPNPEPFFGRFKTFSDSVCEGEIARFEIELDPNSVTTPEAYRWIFPQGWTHAHDTITKVPVIDIKVGHGHGRIRVQGIDTCSNLYPNEGPWFEKPVFAFLQPSIAIVGDPNPCFNQSFVYAIVPSDPFVRFTYEVKPSSLSILYHIVTDAATGIDSVYVDPFNGNSIDFEFSNITHSKCPNLSTPNYTETVYAQMPDPIVLFDVSGPQSVCKNSEHRFIAKDYNTNITEYTWEVPTEWISREGVTSDTLYVRFDALLDQGANVGTIRAIPHTRCDIRNDKAIDLVVSIDTIGLPSPILDARNFNQVFNRRPCQNDTMMLFIRKTANITDIVWRWDGSSTVPSDGLLANGWILYDIAKHPDSLGLIVPSDNKNPLKLSIQIRNQCGLGIEQLFELTPSSPIIKKPLFTEHVDTLCPDQMYTFIVDSIPDADRYFWQSDWGLSDTTYLSPRLSIVPGHIGSLWAIPANGCGHGPESDTLTIKGQYSEIGKPMPLDFAKKDSALYLTKDLLHDTLCLRTDRVITVAIPNESTVSYRWFVLSGDPLTITPNGAQCTIKADLIPAIRSKKTVLGVSAIRQGCLAPGDTLKTEIYFTDTVSVAFLNKIILDPTMANYCQGQIVSATVGSPIAPAYQWSWPSDWQLIDSTQLHRGKIELRVGSSEGKINVAPITDAARAICPYVSNRPVQTITLKPHPAPILNGFVNPTDTVCQGSSVQFEVDLHPLNLVTPHSYLWIFPDGFMNPQTDGNLDTFLTTTPVISFPLNNAISGMIQVMAIDSSCAIPTVSAPLKRHIEVIGTPFIDIIGNLNPCRDSTEMYLIRHPLSMIYSINLSDAAVVGSEEWIEGDGYTDTLYLTFDESNRSYELTFTEFANPRCPAHADIEPIIISIVSDTVPTIYFTVDPLRSRACFGSDLTLSAKLTTDPGFPVSYIWSPVRDYTYKKWESADSDSATFTTGVINNETIRKDTVMVYAKGGCGISKIPNIVEIQWETPPALNTQIFIGDTTGLCETDTVKLWINKAGFENTASIQWRYNGPWVDGSDTLKLPAPGESFSVFVRVLQSNTCGWSEPSSDFAIVRPHPLPVIPRVMQNLYPCKESELGLSYRNDPLTDSIFWSSLDAMTFTTLSTGRQPRFDNDSIFIADVSTTPFRVLLRAKNICGSRGDTLRITPSDSLANFIPQYNFDQIRLCFGDTVMLRMKVPYIVAQSGAQYQWTLPDRWVYIEGSDSLSLSDTAVFFKIIPSDNSGQISVIAYGCGTTDEVLSSTIDPVIVRARVSGPETANFMSTTEVINVNRITNSTVTDNPLMMDDPEAYFIRWLPENRFYARSQNSTDGELRSVFLPEEQFILQVRERDPNLPQGCGSSDTVKIKINNSFDIAIDMLPKICKGLPVEMHADIKGGANHHQFVWLRYKDSVWESLDIDNQVDAKIEIYDSNMLFLIHASDTIVYDYVNELGQSIQEVYIVYDTAYSLEVEVLDSIIATITKPYAKIHTVNIGDKLNLIAKIRGREPNYEHYVTQWGPDTAFMPRENLEGTEVLSKMILGPSKFYFVVIDTLSSCQSSDTIDIRVTWDFGKLPGGFTPNGDGINDVFMKGVDMVILNRWGVELYRTTAKEGWDGTHKGRLVDSGDYFYIISVKDENNNTYSKTGVVTVFLQ